MKTLAQFIALLAMAGGISMQAAGADKQLMLIGTYTTRGSEGIYAAQFDPQTGKIDGIRLVAKATNPSFLALDPAHKFLYAVNEVGQYNGKKAGSVKAFALDRASGALTELNEEATGGGTPCHLAVDASGKHLVIANYGDGTAAIFPILPDGRLAPVSQIVKHEGSGPDAARQKGPHAHGVTFDPSNNYVFIPDLGIDKIMGYKIDAAAHKLIASETATASVTPGSGPRHFTFHPNGKNAYSISEMNPIVTAFTWDAATGGLKPFSTAPAAPADFTGKHGGAEIVIHPNGKWLYASNRGEHNAIAVFTIGADMKPAPVQYEPCGGKAPRNFSLDPSGRFLVSGHQDTDNIVVFKIDQQTGKLSPAGCEIKQPAPVCIIFP